MQRKNLCLLSLCFILVAFLLPLKLFAAPYYEGKMVKIIVGHEAGGGYDQIARILSKYFPKYIPGNPTVFVENMVGGGSVIAANHLFNVAKPDGLTIGLVDRGLPFAQLLKAEGIKFDLRKFLSLGSLFSDSFILSIRADLPYKSYSDLLNAKKPIHLGSAGPQTLDYQYPAILKEFTGLNCNIVIYKSGAASFLAVERKEVDGKAGAYAGLKPYIERGVLRAVIRGRVSEPDIEGLPLDESFSPSKMGKTIMAMLSTVNHTGRWFLVPPGTPPETLAVLRTALAKASEDQELKANFKKMFYEVRYIPQEESVTMLNFVLNQPADVVKEFGKFIKF